MGKSCLDLETLEKREVVTETILLVNVFYGRERSSGLGKVAGVILRDAAVSIY